MIIADRFDLIDKLASDEMMISNGEKAVRHTIAFRQCVGDDGYYCNNQNSLCLNFVKVFDNQGVGINVNLMVSGKETNPDELIKIDIIRINVGRLILSKTKINSDYGNYITHNKASINHCGKMVRRGIPRLYTSTEPDALKAAKFAEKASELDMTDIVEPVFFNAEQESFAFYDACEKTKPVISHIEEAIVLSAILDL